MFNNFFHLAAVLVTSSLLRCLACAATPIPAVVDSNNAWKTTVFGCSVVPLLVDEIHGPVQSNFALLTIPPGVGFPPHRHPGVEEHLFFLGGSGQLTVWLPNTTEKVRHEVKTGSFHYLPSGGIHKLWNTGSEDLKLLLSQTPGPLILEMFEDWPKSLNVPVGNVVHLTDFIDVIAKEKLVMSKENTTLIAARPAFSGALVANVVARYWQQWTTSSF